MAGSPAPTLLALRDAINQAFPSRSKASDGIMGDAAHQARASDHNNGDALDVTYDPENGPDLDALAVALLADPRVHYVIWKQRIANPEIEGGAWRAYSGTNPHTKHLHVSIYPARRDDVDPWQIDGVPASPDGTEAPETKTAGASSTSSGSGGAIVLGVASVIAAVGLAIYVVTREPAPAITQAPIP